MAKVKALVISGYGINCERELALACKIAGADTCTMHVRHFFDHHFPLEKYRLILFPGGFSFGDELGAAKVLANKISHVRSSSPTSLKQRLIDFVARGNCILGICNGFQMLVKLGLLPGSNAHSQSVSLAANDSGSFENRWVNHRVCPSSSVFTQGIDQLYLPIRHGEGKFIVKDESTLKQLVNGKQIVLQYADENGKVASTYPCNPNGSQQNIGGISDSTGRILGMMAHPEAALFSTHHPQWTRNKELWDRKNKKNDTYGSGFFLFKNAIEFLEKNQ